VQMKLRTSGLYELGWFLAVFAALLLVHRYFHRLDNLLGIAFFGLIIVAGVISVFRASTGKITMPTLVGALPKSWRRWILGESEGTK
jgi:hypothetical protein